MTTYPALTGDPVTQAHVNVCGTQGHATHTVNGQDTGTCPRCGEVTEATTTTTTTITPCECDDTWPMLCQGCLSTRTDLGRKPTRATCCDWHAGVPNATPPSDHWSPITTPKD